MVAHQVLRNRTIRGDEVRSDIQIRDPVLAMIFRNQLIDLGDLGEAGFGSIRARQDPEQQDPRLRLFAAN